MKFTKFGALALASLVAFSSCSKEEAMNSGAEDLLPGEARIVLNLGKKGPTTYSTIANETAIKNGAAKLFKSSGEAVPMTNATIDPTTGKLTATVAADDVTGAGEVILFAYLNADPITEATGTTAMEKHEDALVLTPLDRELTKGAPAGFKSAPFTLKSGNNPVSAGSAKRAIARLGVQNAAKGLADADKLSIANFQINLTGVILNSGALYGGLTNAASDAEGTATVDYTVDKDGNLDDINLTGNVETVAYMYPSKLVTAVVTSPEGVAKTVTFEPKANMNYTLNITPSKTEGAEIDFTVSIQKKWDDGTDMDVDFTSVDFELLGLDLSRLGNNAVAEGNLIKLDGNRWHDSAPTIDLTNLGVGTDLIKSVKTVVVEQPTIPTGGIKYLDVKVEGTNLAVRQIPNSSGVETPRTKVTVTALLEDNSEVTGSFFLTLPPMDKKYTDALAEATVEMDGKKWVMFNMTSGIERLYARALEIKEAGGIAAVAADKSKFSLIVPAVAEVSGSTPCPVGYRKPTLTEFFSLTDVRTTANYGELWAPSTNDEKTFSNGRVLKNIASDSSIKYCYYTITDGAKVMHMVGNVGLITSTAQNGQFGETVTPNSFYTGGIWAGGLRIAAASATNTLAIYALRCVVDETYTGLK